MQLRAELVHTETGVRVVQLSAWQDGECLGSTLAEAATVELAEAQAEVRLRQRLEGRTTPAEPERHAIHRVPEAPPELVPRRPEASPSPLPLPLPPPAASERPAAPDPPAASSPPAPSSPPLEPAPLDPEDWSDELAQIDLQLQRLGWNREQEGVYLERAYGHPSRSRLTTYPDLLAYSQALATCPPGADPGAVPVPLRRRDLISQCDQLLAQLRWEPAQGRAFLEQHFQLSSRRQLNDEQLLQFNMLLESEVMERSPAGGSASGQI